MVAFALHVPSGVFGETDSNPQAGNRQVGIAVISETSPSNEAIGDTSGQQRRTFDNALTLIEVLDIAFDANPSFAVFEANRELARSEMIQALAYPNPEVEVEAGAGTSRESPRDTEAEYGIRVDQTIDWPWKRRARRSVADASLGVAESEREAFIVSLRADVIRAYWTTAYSIQAVQLADQTRKIASDIETIVRRRVESGEVPEIDLLRARVESLKSSRQSQMQKRRLATSRVVLNALCGGRLPSDMVPADPMKPIVPEYEYEDAVRIALEDHPSLKQLDAAFRKNERVIENERVSTLPDLKVGVFAGRELDKDNVGAAVGVEIPLWDRNQGGRALARAEQQRVEAEIERTRAEVERDLNTAYEEYESAREQLAAFDSGLRSAAAEALQIETNLYEQGETSFLQLLDARRTARETEVEYLQALYDANTAQTNLELVLGIGDKRQ